MLKSIDQWTVKRISVKYRCCHVKI